MLNVSDNGFDAQETAQSKDARTRKTAQDGQTFQTGPEVRV